MIANVWCTSYPMDLFVLGWEYAVDASYGVYGAMQKALSFSEKKTLGQRETPEGSEGCCQTGNNKRCSLNNVLIAR